VSGSDHINFGVLQRSQKQSALGRLAYQTSTYFNDGKRCGDYARYAGEHRGGVILLPPGSSAEFADDLNFVRAFCFREVRVDAQEGRTIDFGLPRELPDHLLLPVAAFAMADFVRLGMAVRVDVECPLASDKGLNPHGHVYVAQRRLESDGQGEKAPEWNALFLRNLGRYARAVISERVTRACAMLGVAAHMDPRRNSERGLPEPEPRIPTKLWRKHERGIYVAEIEELLAARQAKAALPMRGVVSESSARTTVGNAVSSHRPPADKERQSRINFVVPLALDAQAEARGADSGRAAIVLTTRDGSVIFDGVTFSVVGTVRPALAQLIVKLAQALDWPALVVDGDPKSIDEVIVAGVPYGLTAINTCASADAIRLIQRQFGHLLADTVGPLDPCNIVYAALNPTSPKVDNIDFDFPALQPKLARDEENPQLSGTSLFDPDVVVDQVLNREPEIADLTDLDPDLDMPQPKSTREEDERRRQNGAQLNENWLAARHDRLKVTSGREVREHPMPPKARERGPP
jgi:hypothetical protein